MKLFIELVKTNLKVYLKYKYGFLLSIVVHPLTIILNVAVFKSIFAQRNIASIAGYTLTQIIWYFGAMMLVWVIIWNFTDHHLSERILSGDLAINLFRPVSLMKFELADAVASRIMGITFEFIPDFIIYSLICYPDFLTLSSFLSFLPVVMLSFILFYLLNFLIGLTAFIFKNSSSLYAIRFIIVAILGGAYFPLEFFPPKIFDIASILPFQYLFYWPIQIFLNRNMTNSLNTLGKTLLMQSLWIAFLYILCRFFWERASKKFCSAGG